MAGTNEQGRPALRHLQQSIQKDVRHRPIVALLIAAAIPVLLLGGWAAYTSAQSQRTAAWSTANEVIHRVSNEIVAELSAQVQVASALALSTALDDPDLPRFYREAERLAQTHPLWHTIELDDLSGNQVLNLLRPLGAPLGATADRDSFDEVIRTRQPIVGDIGPIGPVSGRRLVALRVPVVRDAELRYVLTVLLAPNAISAILRGAGAPKGWIGAVLDGRGNIIARSVGEETAQAQPASPDARKAAARRPEGFYRGRTLEGIEADVLYRLLPGTKNWTAHLAIPTEMLDSPIRRSHFLLGGGIVTSLALGGALAGLAARDIAQRREEEQRAAEKALSASEERAAIAIESADLGSWRWDVSTNTVAGCARFRELLGLAGGSSHGDEWRWSADELLSSVHEEDRAKLESAVRSAAENQGLLDVEFRTVRGNDTARWVRATGRRPRSAEKDRQVSGVIVDIEERKRAEAERLHLLRQLAEAQEEVQRRISRELHDQVGQTVTGLSLGLKGLETALGVQPEERCREQVRWLRGLAGEIGREIHRAAADLRPTALDDLGLHKALAAYVSEWSRRHGIAAEVQVLGGEERLPSEIETVIYRIVQEALTNVLKHANAANVSLVLERRSDDIRLVVEDDGSGFNPDALRDTGANPEGDGDIRPRLGLSGIHQRLALVGGTMSLESAVGVGTTMFVTIPLHQQARS